MLLCYRITCLWLCNKRVCNETSVTVAGLCISLLPPPISSSFSPILSFQSQCPKYKPHCHLLCVLIPHLQVATKAYQSCFKIPLKPALTSLPLHSSVQACIFPPSNYCKSHRISLSTPNGFYLIIQPTACKALWVLQQTRHAKKSVGFLNLSSYLLILANFLFKINLVTAHTGLKSSVASHCLQVKTPCTAHKDVQHLADPILPTSCSGILSWAL